jgi:bifunctional DNA-binding transcriptional regulator/antitoxin component of YhaV-PrlF toxin-antitoxin module
VNSDSLRFYSLRLGKVRRLNFERYATTVATITVEGQTTIRKSLRTQPHLEAGDRIKFVAQENGSALLVPLNFRAVDLKGMFPKPRKVVSLSNLQRAISQRLMAHTADPRSCRAAHAVVGRRQGQKPADLASIETALGQAPKLKAVIIIPKNSAC